MNRLLNLREDSQCVNLYLGVLLILEIVYYIFVFFKNHDYNPPVKFGDFIKLNKYKVCSRFVDSKIIFVGFILPLNYFVDYSKTFVGFFLYLKVLNFGFLEAFFFEGFEFVFGILFIALPELHAVETYFGFLQIADTA